MFTRLTGIKDQNNRKVFTKIPKIFFTIEITVFLVVLTRLFSECRILKNKSLFFYQE